MPICEGGREFFWDEVEHAGAATPRSRSPSHSEGQASPSPRSDSVDVGWDALPPRPGCAVSLRAVILFTAVVSVAASLAGGLVLFFESLRSLRAAVGELSATETQELALLLGRSFDAPVEA
eukprot:gene26909-56178_t